MKKQINIPKENYMYCNKHNAVYTAGQEYFFGENLKRLRLMKRPKISQERLAFKLGVCRNTYAGYESGHRIPPAWFIFNAANYFEIQIEDILSKNMKQEGMNL